MPGVVLPEIPVSCGEVPGSPDLVELVISFVCMMVEAVSGDVVGCVSIGVETCGPEVVDPVDGMVSVVCSYCSVVVLAPEVAALLTDVVVLMMRVDPVSFGPSVDVVVTVVPVAMMEVSVSVVVGMVVICVVVTFGLKQQITDRVTPLAG